MQRRGSRNCWWPQIPIIYFLSKYFPHHLFWTVLQVPTLGMTSNFLMPVTWFASKISMSGFPPSLIIFSVSFFLALNVTCPQILPPTLLFPPALLGSSSSLTASMLSYLWSHHFSQILLLSSPDLRLIFYLLGTYYMLNPWLSSYNVSFNPHGDSEKMTIFMPIFF